MRVVWKIVVSVLAWLIVSVIAAAAIEITVGRRLPGLVSLITLLVIFPVLLAIWRPMTRAVREWLWAAFSVAAAGLVGVVAVGTSVERRALPPDEWAPLLLTSFAIVSTVRLASWRARVATFLPEIAVTAGVCAVAWGFSGDYSDEQRALIVIGLAVTTIGALALFRSRRDR